MELKVNDEYVHGCDVSSYDVLVLSQSQWDSVCTRLLQLYIVIIVLSIYQCIYDYAVDLDPSLCQKACARD